ncbi:hypothetical protein L2E82_20404 [Cichorium intybus]|uniref:Uncharacterized protein n=1 Tax=Cichorium intybus TaxID=13427 RepID=A0ACB9DTJ5_CICIN|nr:hypothetical protein L2E82_20404 [Cichorium intybus]
MAAHVTRFLHQLTNAYRFKVFLLFLLLFSTSNPHKILPKNIQRRSPNHTNPSTTLINCQRITTSVPM